jgi:hypothetical protein
MDNQLLNGRSWLLVAPTDNLRQDFSSRGGFAFTLTSKHGGYNKDGTPESPVNM